jgi:hypothetical protein
MRTIWLRVADQRGTVLLLSLFVMMFLLVAGAFLLRMSSAETDISYNTVWGEGSFFAAEAGLSVAVDAIGPTTTAPCPTAPSAVTPIDGHYSYQGNSCFIGTTNQPRYAIGYTGGYVPSGYRFNSHNVTGTGTGPRNAQRQIQARALFGPTQ